MMVLCKLSKQELVEKCTDLGIFTKTRQTKAMLINHITQHFEITDKFNRPDEFVSRLDIMSTYIFKVKYC